METIFFPVKIPSSPIILACVKLTKLTKLTSMGVVSNQGPDFWKVQKIIFNGSR